MSGVQESADGLFDANSTLLADVVDVDSMNSSSQPMTYQCYDNGTLVVPVQVRKNVDNDTVVVDMVDEAPRRV